MDKEKGWKDKEGRKNRKMPGRGTGEREKKEGGREEGKDGRLRRKRRRDGRLRVEGL
jgi:hypothetical protein